MYTYYNTYFMICKCFMTRSALIGEKITRSTVQVNNVGISRPRPHAAPLCFIPCMNPVREFVCISPAMTRCPFMYSVTSTVSVACG